MSVKM